MARILNLRGPIFSGKTTALRRRTLGGANLISVPLRGMDNSFPVTLCDDGVALLGRYIYHPTGKETTADALPIKFISRALRTVARWKGVRVVLFEGDQLSLTAGQFPLPTFPPEMTWAFLDTPVPILRERASGFKYANPSITPKDLGAAYSLVLGTRTRAEAEGRTTVTVPWETADEFIQQWIEETDA